MVERLSELDLWALQTLVRDLGAQTVVLVGAFSSEDVAAIPVVVHQPGTAFLWTSSPVDLVVFAPDLEGDNLCVLAKQYWPELFDHGVMAFCGGTTNHGVAGAMKLLFGLEGAIGHRDVQLATRDRDELRRDGGRAYDRSTVYFCVKEPAAEPAVV